MRRRIFLCVISIMMISLSGCGRMTESEEPVSYVETETSQSIAENDNVLTSQEEISQSDFGTNEVIPSENSKDTESTAAYTPSLLGRIESDTPSLYMDIYTDNSVVVVCNGKEYYGYVDCYAGQYEYESVEQIKEISSYINVCRQEENVTKIVGVDLNNFYLDEVLCNLSEIDEKFLAFKVVALTGDLGDIVMKAETSEVLKASDNTTSISFDWSNELESSFINNESINGVSATWFSYEGYQNVLVDLAFEGLSVSGEAVYSYTIQDILEEADQNFADNDSGEEYVQAPSSQEAEPVENLTSAGIEYDYIGAEGVFIGMYIKLIENSEGFKVVDEQGEDFCFGNYWNAESEYTDSSGRKYTLMFEAEGIYGMTGGYIFFDEIEKKVYTCF